MINFLSTSKLLITLPGLSIIWDAILTEIPTIVIPGANYSQHRQPETYRKFVKNLPLLNWGDISGYKTLPPGMDEPEAVRKSTMIADQFVQDEFGRQYLREWITHNAASAVVSPQLANDHPYGDLHGAERIATYVEKWESRLVVAR